MYSVALVCEGPADRVILEAILDACLDDYEPLYLQPPRSAIGGDAGPLGGGWKGVRAWCRQEARVGGAELRVLRENASLIIIHIDADVAQDSDSGIALVEGASCPPPTTFTEPVRAAVLSWLGVCSPPLKLLLCIPAMATETWALVALYPLESGVLEGVENGCIECDPEIKQKLRRLGRKRDPKLVTGQGNRLKNHARGYQAAAAEITAGWPAAISQCTEAARFDRDLREQLPR